MSSTPDSDSPRWTKSSFSVANAECVEVATLRDGIGVRDSKDPEGGILYFTRGEFDAFVRGVLAGEFEDFR